MKHAILAAILAIPMSVPPALAQEADKATYDKRCARCHSVSQAVDLLRRHPEAAERAEWLERKLAGHYARDPKERAAIIAFLEQELAAYPQ